MADQSADLVPTGECSCGETHDPITAQSLGMVCGRCGEHTGNNNQGHYWGLCKVLLAQGFSWQEAVRDLHFCCPGDCSLEHLKSPEMSRSEDDQ